MIMLTRMQRHTAYIIMAAEISEGFNDWGFCIWIKQIFNIGGNSYNEVTIKKYFPELWKRKPESPYQHEGQYQGCLWFNSRDPKVKSVRLAILSECIKETA